MPRGHWRMDEVCNNTQVTSACHKAWIICNWFLEHDIEFTVLKDLHSHQSQSSRAPLRWDGTVDLRHACTVDRSAATVSYCHVNTGQKSLRNEPFHEWWPTKGRKAATDLPNMSSHKAWTDGTLNACYCSFSSSLDLYIACVDMRRWW